MAIFSDTGGGLARLAALLFASGLVFGIGGCDAEPDASRASSSPIDVDDPRGWRLVEELRVGGELGPAFGQIPDLAVSPGGGVYVLDGDAREIIQIDERGDEIRRMGGPGDGAGLLDYPRRLRLVEGVLWVDDLGAGRWSAFDTTGSFLRSLETPARIAGGNADMTPDGLVGIGMFREGDAVSRFRAGGFQATRGFAESTPWLHRRFPR